MNISQMDDQQEILLSGKGEKKPLIISQAHTDDDIIEDIHSIFNGRQLEIINDLSNNNCNVEIDIKQELVGKSLRKGSKGQPVSVRKRLSSFIVRKTNDGDIKKFKTIIKPEQRVLWDLFTMIIIIFAIIILPVEISFSMESDFLTDLNYFTIAIFSVDIIINFNTAYQYKGHHIEDRKLIAYQYLKLWFWIDLFSTFPFDLIVDGILSADQTAADEGAQSTTKSSGAKNIKILRILKFFRLIKVIRLLRVLKLKKIFSKFEDFLDFSQSMISLYQVIKLVCIMLFVAHWLACIWHFIGDQENLAGSFNWLIKNGIDQSDWYTKYIASIYWATATMTTVGYGDIVPVTTVEKIFGMIVMLLACCIFAYIMNSIGGIFVTMDQNEKIIRQKMGQANQFLNSNEIPPDMQARVRKYLEYKYEKESNQVDEKQALIVLSSSLRDEVLAEVNIEQIKKSKLSQKCEDAIIIQLPFLLEEQIFGPEECIFMEGENSSLVDPNDERCLYFLNQGQVMICLQKTFTWLKTLDKGATFGELGFYSNKPRSASVYTLDFVYVQKLRKQDFLNLIKTYQNQSQKYQEDRYVIELQSNFSPLEQQCFGCGDKQHFAINCPKMHFMIDQEQLLELAVKLRKQQQSFAKNYKRHDRVRYNSRGQLNLTKEVADEINFVQQGQEENDEEKLMRIQQHEEEQITQAELFNDHKQQEFKNALQNEEYQIDRMCQMTSFLVHNNAETIIQRYNQLSEQKHLKFLQSDRGRQKFIIPDRKKSNIKSASAERAVYFQKLIDKYGGPAQLLEKLQ